MKILAIETSCDETACAIVENGVNVLSSVIFSQIAKHKVTGGVVPEVAAREHLQKIIPSVELALSEAKMELDEIDAIAVTQGPGLLSSLIIGFASAKTLAYLTGKKLIPVNHIAGHLFSISLGLKDISEIEFPVLTLTVSGGHNDLVLQKKPFEFELLGETLDDAAGEAFDKTARLLGLGYPGGPEIEKAARKGQKSALNLPRAMLKSGDLNFSFSGLKTAVRQIIEKSDLNERLIADIAFEFQDAVCDILSEKLKMAAERVKPKEIHLVGGVSANLALRTKLEAKLPDVKIRFVKNLQYCTDNAAMIASAAYWQEKFAPIEYFDVAGESGAKSNTQKMAFSPDPQLNLYDEK